MKEIYGGIAFLKIHKRLKVRKIGFTVILLDSDYPSSYKSCDFHWLKNRSHQVRSIKFVRKKVRTNDQFHTGILKEESSSQ